MTDEKFTFVEDLRDKKKTTTGAYHKRTHCGKGGAVKFPSDFMTKKEREAMNGEVKSYKLNDPMTWKEFKTMPDDLQIAYIKALRERYGVSDTNIFKMMGICQSAGQRHLTLLGISGERRNGRKAWDKDGWYAWANGVKIEKCPTEDETPIEKCVPESEIPVEKCEPNRFSFAEIRESAVPNVGAMKFTAPAADSLETIKKLLGNSVVTLTVTWEVENGR